MTKGSDPAFPTTIHCYDSAGNYRAPETHGGLSKRLWIATKLAAGDMAATHGQWSDKFLEEALKKRVAFYYRIADALIKGEKEG